MVAKGRTGFSKVIVVTAAILRFARRHSALFRLALLN